MASSAPAGVSAVVLAAGSSRRFEQGSKLLADVAGRPLLAWTVSAFVASRAAEVIVVTGPDPQALAAALAVLPVRFAHNPDHLSGMGGSVAAGIAAVVPESSGALICPGDMPGVTSELVDHLISAFEASGSQRILRPVLPDGRPGNPVLWPRRHFPRLAELRGPVGGRALMGELADDVEHLPWPDAGTAFDIDTQEDLERYGRAKRRSHGSS
ncbi:MAG: nucleotidyltransferase family protein [Hyphomicrobiaceae bacterium]|nr:nucleotidyltransferase family protein [Hyphomicrobiaceae bacterium]